MKYIAFLLFPILLMACNPSASNNTESDAQETTEIQEDNPVINPETLVIKEKCAVILSHSYAEIDSMRKIHAEDVFVEIASDIGYYTGLAKEILEDRGIKVIDTDKTEIIFEQSNGEQTRITRKNYDKDLLFFAPDKKPLGTFTADFEKDLSYFGVTDGREFVEGYWVGMQALDSADEDYVFRYFYKTSFINDEPLLQVFDNGNILVEEVLLKQKNGSYKQGKEAIFYEFRDGEDITVTELGMIRGLINVTESRVSEK